MMLLGRFEKARAQVDALVRSRASLLCRLHGKTYGPSADAPGTLPELRQEWREKHFRVWEGNSDRTIYLDAAGNYAFRFWHDSLHVLHNKSTTLADELSLGNMHTTVARNTYGQDAALLMRIDTIMQSKYESRWGEFPTNQLGFAWGWFRREAKP